MRRQFDLLPKDERFLNDYGLPWEAVVDGSKWILIHKFPTGDGYDTTVATAAIRIETGYPKTKLDMVYFYPSLARKDGKAIGATEARQMIDGQSYQRWSRHRTALNPWDPNEDYLGTHIVLIEDWLEREFKK